MASIDNVLPPGYVLLRPRLQLRERRRAARLVGLSSGSAVKKLMTKYDIKHPIDTRNRPN